MLEVNADKLDKGVWPYPVVVLFLREKELTPEMTLEAAGDNVDHRCEAEWRWLQGDRAVAIASLQAANKDCRKQLVESAAAEAELKRLSN